MARTKQTERQSTGGKNPAQQLQQQQSQAPYPPPPPAASAKQFNASNIAPLPGISASKEASSESFNLSANNDSIIGAGAGPGASFSEPPNFAPIQSQKKSSSSVSGSRKVEIKRVSKVASVSKAGPLQGVTEQQGFLHQV